MKKTQLIFAGLIVSGAVISCSSDDRDKVTNENPTEIADSMKSGTWKITNFAEDGNDETHHFDGYTFTFSQDGTLTAVGSGTTHEGEWSVIGSGSDIDFNIDFESSAQMNELTDDWDIVSTSNLMLKLKDVSGGNGGTDYLTFKKN